jgi:hypothetical protein
MVPVRRASVHSIAQPFEWKFKRADLTALIARMRARYAQTQLLQLAV